MRSPELQGVLFGEDLYTRHDATIKCGLRNIAGVPEERKTSEHWSWIEDRAWQASMQARVRCAKRGSGRRGVQRTSVDRAVLYDF